MKRTFVHSRIPMWLRLLSCIVSIALCVQSIPVIATNTQTTTQTKSQDTSTQENIFGGSVDLQELTDAQIVEELTDKREENIKYFRLTDGTSIAAIYDEPVHKQNDAGAWQDIDNRLHDTDSDYENTDASVRVKFSKNPKNGKLYTLKGENYQIKWSLPAMKNAAKKAKLLQKESDGTVSKLTVHSRSEGVVYEDVLPGVSLEYCITGNGLKENIILSDKSAAQSFTFELQVTQMQVVLIDNALHFVHDNGETVYTMTAPWMMDAAGITSDAIAIGLTGSGNHYTVILTPDMDWLETAEYPVTIDPVLAEYLSTSQIKNTTITSNGYNRYSHGIIMVGSEKTYGKSRGIMRFELPNQITSSDRVIQSVLTLTKTQLRESGSVTVNLHKINSGVSVDGTTTWADLDGNYSDIVVDSQIVPMGASQDEDFPVYFNVTTAVRDWYQNGNNNGLAFVWEDESSGINRYVTFFSANSPTAEDTEKPAILIQYANHNGLENSLTYHTAGGSTIGMVSVSDFTGNLVYTLDDVTTTGNYLPISVSHVFDNARRNNEKYETGTAYFGDGFRLNLYQRMLSCSISGYPYRYLDADGTWHYFKIRSGYENESETAIIYEDEFHPTRTMQKMADTTNGVYRLRDGSGIDLYFNSDGYLTRMIDTTTGKQMTIQYSSGTYHINKVIDGADREISFAYTVRNGKSYLHSITDPAGRVTEYTYTGTKLTQIERPDGSTVSFTYDAKNCLTSVTDSYNSGLLLTYYTGTYNGTDALYRVKTVTERGRSLSEGQKMTFTYGIGETTVTDRNGIYETMMFDDFGHTVCVKNEAGASYAAYDSGAKQNFLKYTTQLQGDVCNYVANGDFEDNNLSPWVVYPNSTATGFCSRSTTQKYDGSYSMELACAANTGLYGYYQPLTIDSIAGNTYTLSAYVNITNLSTDETANSGLVMAFAYNTSGGTLVMGECTYVQNTTSGWTRVSHTFTVPSTAAKLYAFFGLEKAYGAIYIDNVQVESGAVANNYNYIDNGHFRDSVGTITPSAWVPTSVVTQSGTDKIATLNGRRGFLMEGVRNQYKSIEQTVMTSGTAGDKFTFGAMAYAEGALSHDDLNDGVKRNFEIRITVVRTDGTEDKTYFKFEPNSNAWQFLSGEVQAQADYSSVRVAMLYNYQQNTVLFDQIQLFKEGCNTIYTRDSKGRLTQETAVDGKVTKYTYVTAVTAEDCDDRLSRVVYPNGTYETYTYDSAKRLKTYTDAAGVTTTYNYDANGNLIDTVATRANSDLSLVSGTTDYTGAYATGFTDAFGYTSSSVVNSNTGLVSSVTDNRGTVTNYTYDTGDRILSVMSGNSKVAYQYSGDRLTHIGRNTTSSPDNTSATSADVLYTFTHDQFGAIDTIAVGSRTLINHDYAANNGHLTKSTYGNGFYTQPIYDSLDRVVGMKYNGAEKFRWVYGANGQIGLHKDLVNGMEYRYEYDSAGRLLRSVGTPTSANGFMAHEFLNTYDTNGHLTAIQRIFGTTVRSSSFTYNTLGQLKEESHSDIAQVDYGYDALGRPYAVQYSTPYAAGMLTYRLYYSPGSTANTTTTRLEGESFTGNDWSNSYSYLYNQNGNIQYQYKDQALTVFGYDSKNQLTSVLHVGGDSYSYIYDNGGNITGKMVNGVTTATYTYGDSTWKDLLTNYNGQSITYDTIGNPLTWRNGMTLTWQGRRLQTITSSGLNLSYAYNADGIRTQKTVNGTTFYYTLDGGRIVSQKEGINGTPVYYEYTADGKPLSLSYASMTLYYVCNAAGDVLALVDRTGAKMIEYTYGPFGEIQSTTGMLANHLGSINPFRYRGYYYDVETGFYLTGTRYYDPEVGRFINADGYVSTGQGILGNNMFAYCGNNPVNRADPTGMFWKEIGDFFSNTWNGIKTWAKNTFGAGSSTTATIAEIETPVIPDPSPITVKTGTKTTQTISKHGDSSKPISVYANKDAQHPIKSSSAGININIVNFTLDLSIGLDDIGLSGSLTNGNTTNSFGVKLNLSELKVGFEGSTAIQWDNTTETAYTNASISGWAIAAAYILVTTGQYVQSPSYAY